MQHRYANAPAEAGKQWAEERADELRDDIPAIDWPDVWPEAWDAELELPELVGEHEAPAYRAAAHHAAAERWVELLTEQRDAEGAVEEEEDAEARAIRLFELLDRDLPAGLTAGRDGPRVYLRDRRGMEMTVESLRDAWRVVSEYDERYTR